MDAAELVRTARIRAALSVTGLASRAGTSRSALAEIEAGRRSPTVRTLNHLLRVCDLQIRPTLEPYLADLDAALNEALTGAAPILVDDRRVDNLKGFASALDAAGVRWAIDGATAVSLHGLAVAHDYPCLVVVDDLTSRAWLRSIWAKGFDRHGFSLAPNWEEPPEQVRLFVREPVWTRLGSVQLRFVDDLGPTVPVMLDGRVLPVVPLLEVEQVAPQLADLLARWRQRRAQSDGTAPGPSSAQA
jgi:transcriptional regulator with XRE-family HTH domain